jgi:Domain of unknown function (DUF6817)
LPEIAQTNLQLYNQLVTRGWSETDLDRTRRAYELATDLFAGQLRPSGKTFLAHLVGTASAVAAGDGRVDLVLAGLVHAAYTHGEFGDARRDAAAPKRGAVRSVIGSDAESLVHGYGALGYREATIDDWVARAGTLSRTDHDLVVLRMANEIDDHVDLGTRFCDRRGDPMATDESGVVVPAVLRSPATASIRTAPRSHRLRLVIAFRNATVPVRARLARIPMARRAYHAVRLRLVRPPSTAPDG